MKAVRINPIDDVRQMQYFDKYNENSEVLDAVLSLPDKYKIVIHLYYYEEYSTPEIAHILGKSETSIRSILHRARNKFKGYVKGGI